MTRVYHRAGSRVWRAGIDHGTKEPTLEFETADFAVIKEHGRSYWQGLYMSRGYAPTEYLLVRKGDSPSPHEGDPHTRMAVFEIIRRVTPGRRWKFHLSGLKFDAKQLQRRKNERETS